MKIARGLKSTTYLYMLFDWLKQQMNEGVICEEDLKLLMEDYLESPKN